MVVPDTSYSPANYEAQGGSSWVVGATGTLDFAAGAKQTNAGTQAAAIVDLTDSTCGTLTAGGTLTAFAVSGAGTVTAAQVAILNNNFACIQGVLVAVKAAIKGVGIVP